jgi:membrane protein
MKKYINWVLGALAATTAVAALRPRPDDPDPIETEPEPQDPNWFDAPLSLGTAIVSRLREHHMPMIAGSLAYYALLALFPTAIAAISIYGLVLDPADLASQIESITNALPKETAAFLSSELTAIVESSDSGLGAAAAVSILAAFWSASAGTKALIMGIDIAYETPENRSFVALRGMALGITVALIVFVTTAASAVTFLPDLLDAIGADDLIELVEYGRWPTILVMVIFGLGMLYKLAPNRPARESPWISIGSLVVAVLWVLATVGFSAYANQVPSLGAAYGTLSAVIVLLLWFFISGLIVLTGAELNAELEARNLAHLHTRNGRNSS